MNTITPTQIRNNLDLVVEDILTGNQVILEYSKGINILLSIAPKNDKNPTTKWVKNNVLNKPLVKSKVPSSNKKLREIKHA